MVKKGLWGADLSAEAPGILWSQCRGAGEEPGGSLRGGLWTGELDRQERKGPRDWSILSKEKAFIRQ